MPQDEKAKLRERIDEVLRNKDLTLAKVYTKSLEELIEDLKIYQYELEFQNDELKRISEDLENTKNDYEQLFRFAPLAYVIIDAQFKILKRNKRFEELFGEHFFGQPMPDIRKLIMPACQDEFYFFFQRLLNDKSHEVVELEMYSDRKQPLFMQLTGNVYFHGSEVHCRLSLLDITEQKQTLKALGESEREKRMITDNMTDIIVVSEPDGKITYASPSIRLIGYTVEDFIGKSLFDFVNPGDLPAALKAFNEGIAAHQNNATTFRTYRKDGLQFWVEASGSLVFSDNGKIEKIVFVVRNIEDRKRAEIGINYAHKLLSEIGELASIGAWELDLISGTLYLSEVTRKILEVPDDFQPDLESAINFYLDGSDKEAMEVAYANAVENGLNYDLELRIRTFKGKILWVRSMGVVVKTEDKISGLRGLFQDINEKKMAEISMIQLTEQLKETNLTKDQLFSIIAHDLRSPFNAFLNLTQLLFEEINTFSQQEILNLSRTIYSSATNLHTLVENLLEWSRLQRGMLNPQLSVNIVKESVLNVAELLSHALKEKSQRLIIEADERYIARYDKGMVSAILHNLISNAIKFTPREGEIRVILTTEPGRLEIQIVDSGIGIPEEIQPYLFEINNLKGRRGTNGEKSSGLGLVISKELAELQGGKLSLIRSDQTGSCFALSLPDSMLT